jgi:hypothetical protein
VFWAVSQRSGSGDLSEQVDFLISVIVFLERAV